MYAKVDTKLIKRLVADWLKVLVFLLDDAAVLLLIILSLRFLGIRIPLPVTVVMAILLGSVVFIIHKAIIPDFRKRPVIGPEGMIGVQGRVVKALTPIGTVIVNGEHWRARSLNGNIGINKNVEIVGLDRLTLKVKRKDQ